MSFIEVLDTIAVELNRKFEPYNTNKGGIVIFRRVGESICRDYDESSGGVASGMASGFQNIRLNPNGIDIGVFNGLLSVMARRNRTDGKTDKFRVMNVWDGFDNDTSSVSEHFDLNDPGFLDALIVSISGLIEWVEETL